MLNLKIIKKHPDAVIPFKNYESDFCYDCVATSMHQIDEKRIEYGLGFGLQFENDQVLKNILLANDISIDFRPRSSIHKTGLILTNSVGTGDLNYTGEYKSIFYIIDDKLPRYQIGDRIVQLKIGLTPKVNFTEVSFLNETDRGNGGFGSTNK